MAVRVHTFGPDDCIEGFKRFCGKEDCWAEATNVGRQMKKDMKFWFVKPPSSPACGAHQEVVYFGS
jgi:hypothetical protein